MADTPTVTSPDFTGVIDQSFLLRPLGGPRHPQSYLDRFPEEVYNKGLDSHLVRFIYALLGPAGVGWLRKNYLEARLKLEDLGIETFDLDRFYGDPLRFGRILEEQYDEDPHGLIPRDKWDALRSKDAHYRSRAIDYVAGARAGNTPLGMRLVARSGLGHEVEVIEQYHFLWDQLADDPLDLINYGQTALMGEFVILPRRELPIGEVQRLTIQGSPTGGTFQLFFPVGNEVANTTAAIAYNAPAHFVQAALEAVPTIGTSNVVVTGGPLPDNDVIINFVDDLGYQDVPKLQAISGGLTGGTAPFAIVSTERNGTNQSDEIANIAPRDQHYLKESLNRIKPVASVVTFGKAPGTRKQQIWNSVYSTSTYSEVVRYVVGQTSVPWPTRDTTRWIERGVEHQAPRAFSDLQHHYYGLHNVGTVTATDESDAANSHIGPFTRYQQTLYPLLSRPLPADYQYQPDMITADYSEPLTVTANTDSDPPVKLVNGVYPQEYQALPGVPPVRYRDEQFWASRERPSGIDVIEIDLGRAQAVNYLYFEATRKPYDIEVAYDSLDQEGSRDWVVVTPQVGIPFPPGLAFSPASLNPWEILQFWFTDVLGEMIYTRYLRIRLTRRNEESSPFLATDGTLLPFSIEIRNLRLGRSVV